MNFLLRISFSLLFAAFLSNCASTGDERLDNRLDRREQRQDERLDRMTKRSDSRGNRWEKMADWEEERAAKAWDRNMGRDPDSEWDF